IPTAPFPRRRGQFHIAQAPPALSVQPPTDARTPRSPAVARHPPSFERKTNMADDLSLNPTRDDFASLLDESMGGRDFMEGQVVQGKVVAIEKDFAIIDVGLKTEGR